MKTVKEISEIAGVSIRTLRYYDEIGLLKPRQTTEAGYRLYDNKDLERLQEIMFFRELEIPLADIRMILENPQYDRRQVLEVQKSMLEKKRNRLNGIIDLITDVMEGVNTMNFEAFNDQDIDQIVEHVEGTMTPEEFQEYLDKYANGSREAYRELMAHNLTDEKTTAQLLRWYGSKDKVLASAFNAVTVQDPEQCRAALQKVYRELAELEHREDKLEEERMLVEKLVECHRILLNLDNPRNFLLDMAEEYYHNDRLREAHDKNFGEGSCLLMAAAIKRYYGE